MSDKQFPACFGCGVGFDQKNLIYEHLPGCTFNPKGHACTWTNCKSCIQGHAEETARMKRWFRVELLEVLKDGAPCLIDGHTADTSVDFKRTRQVGKNTVMVEYPAFRLVSDPDLPKSAQDKTAVDLKLCARCGVVYEEKAK